LFKNLRENGKIGKDIHSLNFDTDLLNEYFVGSSVESSHETESSQFNLNFSFLHYSNGFVTASASDDDFCNSFYSSKGDTSFDGLHGVGQFSFNNVMQMEVLEPCNNVKSNAVGTD
jgi:hypothetical protein